MAIRCGTDIIEIKRIEKAISNEKFINRIYSELEIKYCESRGKARSQSYAVRFAGKEAVAKALGTGFSKGVSYKDIEILVNEDGAPEVKLSGKALDRFYELSAKSIAISLSHNKESALAFVIIE